MQSFVNNFQTLTKQYSSAAQEDFNINIKGYNSVTIFNNTISNVIAWDNIYNPIQPMQKIELSGNDLEKIYGVLKIILFEQVIGFPAPKCVLVKKTYI